MPVYMEIGNNIKIRIKVQNNPDSYRAPEQKEDSYKYTIPDFKLCYRAIMIKTSRYCHKTKHVDRADGTEQRTQV